MHAKDSPQLSWSFEHFIGELLRNFGVPYSNVIPITGRSAYNSIPYQSSAAAEIVSMIVYGGGRCC